MKRSAMLAAACLLLSACGSTTEDRALSGGGIGAGVGAAVGAVTGLSIVQGALIGAGVGAATGALTDEKQIDLGKPAWRKGEAVSAPPNPTGELVRSVQERLNARGFDAGPADGVAGPRTRAAIRSYQQRHALLVDGQPTRELLEHLQRQANP